MSYLVLILGIFFNGLASILIKKSSLNVKDDLILENIFSIISNVYLILGVLFFIITFIFYFYSLTKLPLNVVHPILTSGSIVFVSLFSVIYFEEAFNIYLLCGVILIIIGVFLIYMS